MKYSKPALSVADQINLLKSRGLHIPDPAAAEHFLINISYYRLEGYWWALQSDKINHIFKPGSSFQTVLDLYNFDREIRLLVFDMIERIEIGLRTRLIYECSMDHAPWWFEQQVLFKDSQLWQKHLQSMDDDLKRSKEIFIKEHNKKYSTDQRRPPSWKSMEVISLGLLSKFYENLHSSVAAKDRIANQLGTANHTFLVPWLKTIAVVRNICAHHARLWNRHLPVTPKLLKRAPNPWLTSIPTNHNTLYIALCCMRYLLYTISPGNHFHQKLLDLLQKYPSVDHRAMGFTDDWAQQPLWQP